MRIVPLAIPLPTDLGIAPHVVTRILGMTRGLVLITGPTGAGKSTTIASLLEQINQEGARRHIVTVEDPIEFMFESKNAVIDQREVGSDTKSYARGLKGALRQLPHIIFVGDARLTSMAIASPRPRRHLHIDDGDTVRGANRDAHHRFVPAHQQSQVLAAC